MSKVKLTDTKKDHAEPWRALADSWKLFTSPWRPSKENTTYYENALKEVTRGQRNPKF